MACSCTTPFTFCSNLSYVHRASKANDQLRASVPYQTKCSKLPLKLTRCPTTELGTLISLVLCKKASPATGTYCAWTTFLLLVFFQRSVAILLQYHVAQRTRVGLMVSAGSSSGLGYCVVFLSKTLYSPSAFLHLGVLIGPGYCEDSLTMD